MLLPFLLLGGKMNNCQLFTFQVRKIAVHRKYTENGRTCNENCSTALRQDGLCTRGRQRILLTTKVHLTEAPLFFDQICAIIQKQRFARPRKGQGRAERKTRSLESWKEKN